MKDKRDEFPEQTKHIIGKRVNFICSICFEFTTYGIESSVDKPKSVGIVSHICASSKGLKSILLPTQETKI